MDEPPLDSSQCSRQHFPTAARSSSSPDRVRSRREPPPKPYSSPLCTRPRLSTFHIRRAAHDGVAEEWSPVVQTPIEAVVGTSLPSCDQRAATQPMRERPVCVVRGAVYIEDFIEIPSSVAPGEIVTSTSSATTVGGHGVLQAVAISRAGQRVEMVGSIGPDGESIPPFLTAQGVGNSGVRVPDSIEVPPLLSGRTIHQYTSSNHNPATILIPGTSGHPLLDPLPPSIALRPPVTHIVVGNELPAQRTCAFIDEAFDHGITVILNPAPVQTGNNGDQRQDASSPFTLVTYFYDFPWHKISYLVVDALEAARFVKTLEDRQVRLCAPGFRVKEECGQDCEEGASDIEKSPTQSNFPPLANDERLQAGVIPPVPKKHLKTLYALMSWPPLFHIGIVLYVSTSRSTIQTDDGDDEDEDESSPGVLAVLPSVRSPKSKLFWEPVPPLQISRLVLAEYLPPCAFDLPKHVASTGSGQGQSERGPTACLRVRKEIRTGSIDSVVGYFVAGLMEFALFDRENLDWAVWKGILEKAVMASHLTPRTFPPTPPLPVYAIPHFPTVQAALARVKACYTQQRMAGTSVRPFRLEARETLPESIESMEDWDGSNVESRGSSYKGKEKAHSPNWQSSTSSSPEVMLISGSTMRYPHINSSAFSSSRSPQSPPRPLSLVPPLSPPPLAIAIPFSLPTPAMGPWEGRPESPPLDPPALVQATGLMFSPRREMSGVLTRGGQRRHYRRRRQQHQQHQRTTSPIENQYPSLHTLSSYDSNHSGGGVFRSTQTTHQRQSTSHSPRASGSGTGSGSGSTHSLSPPHTFALSTGGVYISRPSVDSTSGVGRSTSRHSDSAIVDTREFELYSSVSGSVLSAARSLSPSRHDFPAPVVSNPSSSSSTQMCDSVVVDGDVRTYGVYDRVQSESSRQQRVVGSTSMSSSLSPPDSGNPLERLEEDRGRDKVRDPDRDVGERSVVSVPVSMDIDRGSGGGGGDPRDRDNIDVDVDLRGGGSETEIGPGFGVRLLQRASVVVDGRDRVVGGGGSVYYDHDEPESGYLYGRQHQHQGNMYDDSNYEKRYGSSGLLSGQRSSSSRRQSESVATHEPSTSTSTRQYSRSRDRIVDQHQHSRGKVRMRPYPLVSPRTWNENVGSEFERGKRKGVVRDEGIEARVEVEIESGRRSAYVYPRLGSGGNATLSSPTQSRSRRSRVGAELSGTTTAAISPYEAEEGGARVERKRQQNHGPDIAGNCVPLPDKHHEEPTNSNGMTAQSATGDGQGPLVTHVDAAGDNEPIRTLASDGEPQQQLTPTPTNVVKRTGTTTTGVRTRAQTRSETGSRASGSGQSGGTRRRSGVGSSSGSRSGTGSSPGSGSGGNTSGGSEGGSVGVGMGMEVSATANLPLERDTPRPLSTSPPSSRTSKSSAQVSSVRSGSTL